MVLLIEDLEKFEVALAEAGDKLVVVDFTAKWCCPCKVMAPKFKAMSKKPENSKVVFLKVDVDDAADIALKYKVFRNPTFLFFKNGKIVDSFLGVDPVRLAMKVVHWR